MSLPLIDQGLPGEYETATLAMGCFWSPDAFYGAQEGVLRTRVGYAGGSTAAPTYRQLGDHIETLQIDFDPAIISYAQLLEQFFQNHNASREPWKRQYTSALFYHNAVQQGQIQQKIAEVEDRSGKQLLTQLYPYEHFYMAEDRHQKYKLQRQPELFAEFKRMYPEGNDLINSTAAARVNGYLYVCDSREKLLQQLGSFGLSERGQKILLDQAAASSGIACSRSLRL